jgi:hypothetical protein
MAGGTGNGKPFPTFGLTLIFYDEIRQNWYYANKPKLAPLVQEIAWAHNIIIMEKCKNDLSRELSL